MATVHEADTTRNIKKFKLPPKRGQVKARIFNHLVNLVSTVAQTMSRKTDKKEKESKSVAK